MSEEICKNYLNIATQLSVALNPNVKSALKKTIFLDPDNKNWNSLKIDLNKVINSAYNNNSSKILEEFSIEDSFNINDICNIVLEFIWNILNKESFDAISIINYYKEFKIQNPINKNIV